MGLKGVFNVNIELQVPEELDGTAPEQAEDEFDGNTEDDIYEDDDEYSDEEESEEDSDEDDSEDGREDTSRTGRPGIDKVLRDVQEYLSPEHAEVIRGLQRDFVQSNQVDSMRNQLRDALTEVEQLRDSLLKGDNPEGDEREELLSTVPPEQVALLEAVLQSKGYVKKDDLTAMEREKAVEEGNYSAIEKWGDVLGAIDPATGELNLSDDAREKMAPIYDRLVNQQNLTFEDLFVLSNYEDMIQAAIELGEDQAKEALSASNKTRVSRARKGNVGVRSSSGESQPKIYDREKLKDLPMGKKLESVMRKAWNLAASS
jgi:hypothetical protein